MKNIPASILAFDRLPEKMKTPQLEKIIKNVRYTNDVYHEALERNSSSENLVELKKLLDSEESSFFKELRRTQSKGKTIRKIVPAPIITPPNQEFKEAYEIMSNATTISNTMTANMPPIDEPHFSPPPLTKYQDFGFESLQKNPTQKVEQPKKNGVLFSLSIFFEMIGVYLAQLCAFYLIFAFCLWELNPANWPVWTRIFVAVATYVGTNLGIAFYPKIKEMLLK
jgi:hypothetical protein